MTRWRNGARHPAELDGMRSGRVCSWPWGAGSRATMPANASVRQVRGRRVRGVESGRSPVQPGERGRDAHRRTVDRHDPRREFPDSRSGRVAGSAEKAGGLGVDQHDATAPGERPHARPDRCVVLVCEHAAEHRGERSHDVVSVSGPRHQDLAEAELGNRSRAAAHRPVVERSGGFEAHVEHPGNIGLRVVDPVSPAAPASGPESLRCRPAGRRVAYRCAV